MAYFNGIELQLCCKQSLPIFLQRKFCFKKKKEKKKETIGARIVQKREVKIKEYATVEII